VYLSNTKTFETGTFFGLIVHGAAEDDPKVSWIIPFTAGGFIYVATVTVLPELFSKSSLFQTLLEIVAITFGIAIMYVIALTE